MMDLSVASWADSGDVPRIIRPPIRESPRVVRLEIVAAIDSNERRRLTAGFTDTSRARKHVPPDCLAPLIVQMPGLLRRERRRGRARLESILAQLLQGCLLWRFRLVVMVERGYLLRLDQMKYDDREVLRAASEGTQTRLPVTAQLDRRNYPTGTKPTREQLQSLRLKPREVLPQRHSTISPNL